MKYLDTNSIVRIITGDNQEIAGKLIADIERGGANEYCLIDAVLVEVCFVLEFHAYAMARTDIAQALESLMAAPQITVEDHTLAALKVYKKHTKLDYVDCLLLTLGGGRGVVTLDKDLQKVLVK